MTDITIPDSVISIGYGAFSDCSSLTRITIPATVIKIDGYAFEATPWLENQADILIINNILVRHNRPDTEYVIQSSIISIGGNAFHGCSNLTSVVIPDSVHSIGDDAFEHCSALTSIVLPDSVKSIGCNAFYSCSNLTSIFIPASVTHIYDNEFSFCNNLKKIIWPLPWKEIEANWQKATKWKTQLIRGFCEHADYFQAPELRAEYMKKIIPQKKNLVPVFIEEENVKALSICLDAGALKNKDFLDEMISFAAEQGKASTRNMLLDYKKHIQ